MKYLCKFYRDQSNLQSEKNNELIVNIHLTTRDIEYK